MRKKKLILNLVAVCLMLPGCSNVNEYLTEKLEEKTLEGSEILEDQDYLEYQDLEASGKLDDNGIYLETAEIKDEDVDDAELSGQIHVTFAENSHIRLTYYYDAECTEQIDTSQCYLNPGDCIYASEPKIIEAYSNKYLFKEFRIMKYDSNNQPESTATVLGNDNLVFEIPAEYAGDKLSVLPLGRYEARVLTLDDYYLNVDGDEVEFHGTWWIDSEGFSETTVEIDSTVDYQVIYDYSDYVNDYYFVKSVPNPFSADDSGIIEFSKSTPQNGDENYYVLLHRYISVRVSNGDYSIFNQNIIKSISLNGKEQDNVKKKELMLDKLKCGDTITLRIDNGYKVTVSGLEISNPIDVGNGTIKEYKITIPETVERELGITVSKNTATLGGFTMKMVNNAVISVTDENGNILQDGDEVDDNEKLTVSITPTSGYYVTGKKVKDGVYQDTMKYKEYFSNIDKIIEEHPVKKLINVTLDDSDDNGTCVYTIDGEVVSGTISLREGQKIKLEYTLTDSNYQIDSGLFGSKAHKSATLEISEDSDGKTLSREDFNIHIKKK